MYPQTTKEPKKEGSSKPKHSAPRYNTTRDFRATLQDEEAKVQIAKAWPAIDQELLQIQRTVAADIPCPVERGSIVTAIGIVIDKLIMCKDRGDEILENRK